MELHLWLSISARTDAEVPPSLAPAKAVYARALSKAEDDDALLARTTRALAACADDACAARALDSTPFGRAHRAALPLFLAHAWRERAELAWVAVEAFHAAHDLPAEALFARALADLGIPRPEGPLAIDVVAETPPLRRAAILPPALAARGPCLPRDRRAPDGRDDARLLDCVFVHALLDAGPSSPLRTALLEALGPEAGERAFTVLVVHAVAAVVTGWQPKHVSAYRRFAGAAEGEALAWLTHEWRGGAEAPDAFVARYAARWRELHAAEASEPGSRSDR